MKLTVCKLKKDVLFCFEVNCFFSILPLNIHIFSPISNNNEYAMNLIITTLHMVILLIEIIGTKFTKDLSETETVLTKFYTQIK